jgi:hypothetical protein
LGSNQIRFEDKTTRDLVQIKCRTLAARLLSILFDRIAQINNPEHQHPFDQIINFLSTQINFKSGLQRFAFSLLCIHMVEATTTTTTTNNNNNTNITTTTNPALDALRAHLATKLIACLDDENTIYFDEIALMFTRLQKELRFLLTNYQRYINATLGLDLAEFAAKSVFTFDDITTLTTRIQEKLGTQHMGAAESKMSIELRLQVANLVELNRQTYQEQEQLQIRSLFALASACIQLGTLCERMNPLIRPLIECIRFESNVDLQTLASQHLARLLQTCAKRQPNPIPKIFKNLLAYLCNDTTRTPLINLQPNISSLPDKDFYEINRYLRTFVGLKF